MYSILRTNKSGQKNPHAKKNIKKTGVNHGIQRLLPLPWPVVWQRPNQVPRHHPHTMNYDGCAWFGSNLSGTWLISAVPDIDFLWLFGHTQYWRHGGRLAERKGWGQGLSCPDQQPLSHAIQKRGAEISFFPQPMLKLLKVGLQSLQMGSVAPMKSPFVT